ncbi:Disulfide isomerase L-2 isoform 2 [Hibiscus syriacus]|uniref:Disulfide isomerase L-2 isoform 2 n=1 Tax=Hibiscus syriacus TaxID=106335 RepID=A0A6A3CJG8_HIBSY|nr:Disulfide isomerase L-2 isoform 2 [Hibiscus syriacus]
MKRDCPKWKKKTDEKRDESSKSVNVVHDDNSYCSDGDMLSISITQLMDAWILDSGCSYHITPNMEWFSTYMSVNSSYVYLCDDICCNIVGIGEVRIKMYDGIVRTLCDVRQIPYLKKNLIILGTLHKNGFIPKADEDRETIRVVKGALIVKKEKMTAGNIYKLLGSTVTKDSFKTGKHKSEGILDYVQSDERLVYFMKQKYEVFVKFKLWKAEVVNQTGRKIKYLRTDNDTEYANSQFQKFWLPKSLWVEVVSMACYYINRSPRAGLGGKKVVINRDVVFDEQFMLQQNQDKAMMDVERYTVVAEREESSNPTSGGSSTVDLQKFIPVFQEASKLFKGKILTYSGTDARKFAWMEMTLWITLTLLQSIFSKTGLNLIISQTQFLKLSFDEIVLDESKDVLLEIYAPWCRSLEPIYNQLAKHLRRIDSLVIAKMDGTTNEHPSARKAGFPTVLFFPAGNKSSDPYKFLKKHASIPFKLQKPFPTPKVKPASDHETKSSDSKESDKRGSADMKDEL